jgi:hypothetical protein
MICSIAQKLGQRKEVHHARYRTPDDEQRDKYNKHIVEQLRAAELQIDLEEDPFSTLAKVFLKAALETLTPVPPEQKKPYISEAAWKLIEQKTEAIEHDDKKNKTTQQGY